ncbi:MAG: HAMP domain-containing histidine kinase [Streptosporangiaceae bacterium]|nr:HAMP domain-containing histidine kinase [Streptosporangiaceae bacterium]
MRAGRLVRGRTLSARLIAGVLVLLTGACAVIGLVTDLAVRSSMVSSLDGQLYNASNAYVACIEHPPPGGQGAPHDGDDNSPAPNSDYCSRGQPQGMTGIRIAGGRIRQCSIVSGMGQKACPSISAAELNSLLALPAYQSLPPVPMNPPYYTLHLKSLGGDYRLTSIAGRDQDKLITLLPLSDVEHTLGQVALTVLIVFLAVLVLAGVVGTGFVRLSLRPLRRVAATATRVTELPLDSGDVSLPPGVPDSDPRTEVGQVGAAFNRMLGHVERALGRRAASESRLRRFAADASHELRTPLSAIRGYAEFALRHPSPVPDEVRHALNRVQSESARMSVLVDDLLLLARLDAGRPLDRGPVDLSRLAIEATSDARMARGDHRWRLDLPDDPVLVEGDEHRLHQVLANLLSNAGKHTPSGSTVTVALTVAEERPVPRGQARRERPAPAQPDQIGRRGTMPPPPWAELSVTDDGPGIPPDLLPDLFERFTRADTSRAREGNGGGASTGLGLAIVDAVVAAHGGCVTVTSHPGTTRFAIVLPLLPEPAPTPAPTHP